MPLRQWITPPDCADAARRLADETGLSSLAAKVLLSRGMATAEEARVFLSGGPMHDPYLMKDMARAVEAVEGAIIDGKRIVVYGDYDCDGISATVLLYRYLEEQGADVAYYIPKREEGYGLNLEACGLIAENGAGLVITVDNGVTAFDEIAYLAERGVGVVVTDHHQPRDVLPEKALAILNPHRQDDGYPFKELAGVGVAFKLVCALENDADGVRTLERFADIVCLGTIADVVPLTGENRTLAAAGLSRLPQSDNPGLRALLAAAGFASGSEPAGAQTVSYGLAPRLNAASRMGDCEASVDLLLCDDEAEAARLAQKIDLANRDRKKLEQGITEDIRRQLAQEPALLRDRVLVLSGEGWHHGIIGIVASRVMERYGKPCLLISTRDGAARGSARSLPGFSIIDAITACAGHLTKFGGHTLAAGFSLDAGEIPALRQAVNEYAAREHPRMPVAQLRLDALIEPGELDVAAIEPIGALEPFGAGNEPPLFLLRGVKIEELSPAGEGRHLRIRFRFGGRNQWAVCFNMSPESFLLAPGDTGDLAASLSVTEYEGRKRLSIQVKDARPQRFAQEEYLEQRAAAEHFERGEPISQEDARSLTPSREQVALLYRAMRAAGSLPGDPDVLAVRVGRGALSFGQMRLAVSVLCEAGLIEADAGALRLLPAQGKADLTRTPSMMRLRRAGVR